MHTRLRIPIAHAGAYAIPDSMLREYETEWTSDMADACMVLGDAKLLDAFLQLHPVQIVRWMEGQRRNNNSRVATVASIALAGKWMQAQTWSTGVCDGTPASSCKEVLQAMHALVV